MFGGFNYHGARAEDGLGGELCRHVAWESYFYAGLGKRFDHDINERRSAG